MGATEEAKRRAANLRRRGARPVAPEQRRDMSGLEPPAVEGAGFEDPESHEARVERMPAHYPQPGLQPNAPSNKPQPRTGGEVNADLQAYGDALKNYKEEQEEKEEGASDKEDTKDSFEEDQQFEEYLWGDNDLLNNLPRRKRIEGRCEKLSLEDYMMKGGARQRVPIVPGKVEPTFRTTGVDEDLAVKRMMFGVKGTDVYIANRFSLMQLTLSLFALNNDVLPDHLNQDGKFDEELFNKKFDKVSKYPTQLAEDLVNNYLWFDERVKKLFNEDLGNG